MTLVDWYIDGLVAGVERTVLCSNVCRLCLLTADGNCWIWFIVSTLQCQGPFNELQNVGVFSSLNVVLSWLHRMGHNVDRRPSPYVNLTITLYSTKPLDLH